MSSTEESSESRSNATSDESGGEEHRIEINRSGSGKEEEAESNAKSENEEEDSGKESHHSDKKAEEPEEASSSSSSEAESDPKGTKKEEENTNNNNNTRHRSKSFNNYEFSEEEPKDAKPKEEKGKPEPPKKVRFFQLLRYADTLDVIMMIFGAIAAVAFGAVMPTFSLIFGELVDAFNDPDHLFEEVKKFATYFCYAGVVALVSAYMQNAFWMIAAERQIKRLREDYLTAILRQDIGWFDTVGTGELTTRISSDPMLVQEAIGEKVGQLIQYMSTFVLGFALGFYQGWKLTLVLCAVAPLVAICGALLMKILQSLSTKGQAAYARAGSVANEVISAIRTVASFTGEKREEERYNSNLLEAKSIGIKKAFLTGLGLGVTFLIFYGCYALALWYGAELTIKKEYTGGKVLTVFFTVIMGAFALGQASPSGEAIAKGQGAAFKIYETIARQPPIDVSSPEGKKPKKVKGNISLVNVEFSYPTRADVKVFNGLNLEIKKGQTVALVGQSGSGKSSVVSLVQRFYDPQAGSIMLDGEDIRNLNIQWLRNHIGLVGQEPVLFHGTIADNIRYGKESATMEEVEAAARAANAHKFISKFPQGYDTQVGEKGTQLSGGQKQRIAIARAIIKDPKILLLDEATSALDAESEKVVQSALDKVMKGRTTIVVAHRLTTIRDADVIAVIGNGVVLEKGNHEELLALNQHYAELIRIQQGHEEEGRSPRGVTTTQSRDNAITKSISKDSKADAVIDPNAAGDEKEALYDVPLSRLLKLNSSEWYFLVLGCLGAMLNGAINPIFAIIFSHMVDLYYHPADEIRREAKWWSLAFLGVGVAAAIANISQATFFGTAGENLTYKIRKICFASILRQDIGWFDDPKHATGMLTSRLASDATLIESLVGTRLGLTVQNLVTITTGLIIAFFYGWKLTLVVLATSPLIVFANLMYMLAMKGFSTKTQQAVAEANQIVTEAISNIRTVASFTHEPKVKTMYADKLRKPSQMGIRSSHISGFLLGSSQAVMFCSEALCFWYGGKLIHDGENDFLDIMTVFMAIFLSAMAIGQASGMAPNAAKGKTAASVIFQMIDNKSAIDSNSTEGELLPTVKGNVEFRNVAFHYPTRKEAQVFKSLSLKQKPGKVLALVGQSGCGKSSVISLLERFYDPQEGEVLIDGKDIRTLNVKWLRQQISLVGQEPVLFLGSIAENIRYGKPDATLEEVKKAAKLANAHRFIKKFPQGYDTQVGEKGTQLSGGQKQRIAIARAIIKDPKILLLDEATSALDTESEKVVQQALDKVMKGRTTIIVAHRLSTIRNADTIAVVHDGRIAESGTHDELMAQHGIYYKLVQRQT